MANKFDPKMLAQFMAMLQANDPFVRSPAKRAKTAKKAARKPGAKTKATEADVQKAVDRNTAACIKAFNDAGFANVQPRVNVLTFDKWLDKGFTVNKGEKAVQVGNFKLFHQDQVEATPEGEINEA